MFEEACTIAVIFKVSYGWSGGYGLLALILGAARHLIDHPTLDPYVQPTQPADKPTYPSANPKSIEIKNASDAWMVKKRDWAVVCGFVEGFTTLIQRAIDPEYIKPLAHARYGFVNVWPEQYFTHLLDKWCPLDEAASKEVKAHYNRGWDRANNELLSAFGDRLDQEQKLLLQDKVTIHADDKYSHYITEVYNSGVFSEQTIMDYVGKPAVDQDYANARTYFEEKMDQLDHVRRLIGNTTGGAGFGSAMSAQERKELRDIIMEAVGETVAAAIDARAAELAGAAPTDQANALAAMKTENAALKAQLERLSSAITTLTNKVTALQNGANAAGGDTNGGGTGGGTGGGAGTGRNTRPPFTKENKPQADWSQGKKTAWWKWLKKNHSADYNGLMKERIERECAARIAKLSEEQ